MYFLTSWKTEKGIQSDTDKKQFPICWLTLQMPSTRGWGRTYKSSQKSIQVSHISGRSPSTGPSPAASSIVRTQILSRSHGRPSIFFKDALNIYLLEYSIPVLEYFINLRKENYKHRKPIASS